MKNLKINFEEEKFLGMVRTIREICKDFPTNHDAKNAIRVATLQLGYDEKALFSYLQSLLSERRLGIMDVQFNVKGWKKIYKTFIKEGYYSTKLASMLEQSLMSNKPKTAEEYASQFNTCVALCDVNPDSCMMNVVFDAIGWIKILEVVEERANEVINVANVTKGVMAATKRGRKKTSEKVAETSTTSTTVESNQSGEECQVAKESITTESVSTQKGNYNAPILQYTLDGSLVARYESQMDAARKNGYNHSNINANLNGRQKTAYGFIWTFADSENLIATISTDNTSPSKNETKVEKQKVAGVGNSTFAVYLLDPTNNEIDTTQLFGRYSTQQDAADALGAKKSSVSKCVTGKYKSVCTVIDGVRCKVAIICEEAA